MIERQAMKSCVSSLFGLLLLLSLNQVEGQKLVEARIVGTDTMPYFKLPVIRIMDQIGETGKVCRQRYHELIYDVKEVYPYAKFFARKMRELDSTLRTIDDKQRRKAFLASEEKKLKADLKAELKDLTYDQGHILIKLIDRETGKTSYELIKRYKSGFNALMWQSAATVFGMDLKNEYDKDQEEAIEKILDALQKTRQKQKTVSQ